MPTPALGGGARPTEHYQAWCDQCEKLVVSETAELQCQCGFSFRVEWPVKTNKQ